MPRKPAPEKKLGRAIRLRRTSLGLSQEAAAHDSGLDRSYYGSVERGERNVAVRNICLIARALKTTATALMASAGL